MLLLKRGKIVNTTPSFERGKCISNPLKVLNWSGYVFGDQCVERRDDVPAHAWCGPETSASLYPCRHKQVG